MFCLLLGVAGSVPGAEAPEPPGVNLEAVPVTPDASPEARALLAYLVDITGNKILSGQQEACHGGEVEMERIRRLTRVVPAVRGFDFIGIKDRRNPPDADRAISWSRLRHGIITFCWHWQIGTPRKSFYAKDSDFDIARAVEEGTPEREKFIADIDQVARELAKLRDARIPVLWRPFHEIRGGGFWWGSKGDEVVKKAWRLMYDRLARHHKLNNLLWVFNPIAIKGDWPGEAAASLEASYPGDEYVDVISVDCYPPAGMHLSFKETYGAIKTFCGGRKVLALSENGPMPDAGRLFSDGLGWAWFCPWYSYLDGKASSEEVIKATYANPRVINAAQLPDFSDYPAPRPGAAAGLVFQRQPASVSLGTTTMPKPVTVAIVDANGRPVRDATGPVRIFLGQGTEELASAPVVNGIATFSGLHLNGRLAQGLRLRAVAGNLPAAESAAFAVGPGGGIAWERWDVGGDNRQQFLWNGMRPAASGTAKEWFAAPVNAGDNYLLRMCGYVYPPASGLYSFWISGDERGTFWISSDDQPSNRRQIASFTTATRINQWTLASIQHSAPVRLERGKRYYLEAILEEDWGSDHLEVGWTLPDGTSELPIPAYRLDPLFNPDYRK